MFCFQYPPKSHDEIDNKLKNVSKSATDMVLKLLETNQQYRLKSFNQIKIQSFFHNFNFSDITFKKVCTVSYVFILFNTYLLDNDCLIYFQHKPNELLKKLLGETTLHNQVLSHFEEFDD